MSYSYNQNIREIEKYNLEQRKKELREQHALAREMKAKQVGGITDADMIYYNILVKNNNTGFDSSGNPSPVNGPINVVFNEARSQPYLSCAAEYYMSVVRFTIDTPSLPVFIPQPYQKWTDPDKLIYEISIVNTRNSGPDAPTASVRIFQKNIIWEQEDLSAKRPDTAPIDYTNYPYYYCYSFGYFIDLVNKTLDDLTTQAKTVSGTDATIKPPFFTYQDGVITYNAQYPFYNCGIDGTIAANGFLVFFNTSLYNLFSSLDVIKYNEPIKNPKNTNFLARYTPRDDENDYGLNYQILCLDDQSSRNKSETIYTNVDKVPISSSSSYKVFTNICDTSPLGCWNPIENIVFTTSLLPVVSELVAAPTIYSEPYCNPYKSVVKPEIVVDPVTFKTSLIYPESEPTNAAVLSVLTDFATDLYYGTEYKPSISYQPIAEFRLTDLYDEKPINQLEISVFWKDKFGMLHPFKLGSGGTASIKIMFRKKEI